MGIEALHGRARAHPNPFPLEEGQGEVAALRLGLDLGMTLIDTAEMYGEGRAEGVVGEAITGRRAEVFLVSKVYPHNSEYSSFAPSAPLAAGTQAPDFTLHSTPDQRVSLRTFHGQPIVLAFYSNDWSSCAATR